MDSDDLFEEDEPDELPEEVEVATKRLTARPKIRSFLWATNNLPVNTALPGKPAPALVLEMLGQLASMQII